MRPEKVTSPRSSWQLVNVIWSGPDSEPPNKTIWSMAMGYYDGDPVLTIRWDGETDEHKGMPISTGHPVWFVLPGELYEMLMKTVYVPEEKRAYIKKFLGLGEMDVANMTQVDKCKRIMALLIAEAQTNGILLVEREINDLLKTTNEIDQREIMLRSLRTTVDAHLKAASGVQAGFAHMVIDFIDNRLRALEDVG